MSEVLRTAWSVARSGWRSAWNRSFRFSRMKTALIGLALQGLFFFMVARRAPAMAGATAGEGLGAILALMALQMGWFGMMNGFMRGQMQLYQGILVPLFQITPARPLAFLLGRVIEAVPNRAWSTLLWAWVYSGMLGGPARWSYVLLLTAFGLVVGMVAHLSGLLLLSFWGRYSAKSMRNGMMLFGAATLGLVTWAVIYVSKGGTFTDLALVMREYRLLVFGVVLALTGIPGLFLLMALLVRPVAVEDLYRQGVYQVMELNDQDVTRPNRSMWLPIGDSVLRAVLSREWLELARSKVARIQLLIWAAGTVGVFFAGQAVAAAPVTRQIQFVGALSLLAWFMSYGHWVVRVFEKERRTMLLYRLTGVPAHRLILAKFTSVFVPSALLVSGSVLAGALGGSFTLTGFLSVLGWTLTGLAAGTFGGFGMAAATAGESEDAEMDRGPRPDGDSPQTTNSAWWALARTVALLVTAGLPIWAGAGQPGLPSALPVLAVLGGGALLPLVLLVAGYQLMSRTWDAQ